MKAVICPKYGPPEVLQIREIDRPVPQEKEILIQIRATSVHRGDTRIRGLDIPGPEWQKLLARLALGLRGPRKSILGMELAGIISETGPAVTRWKSGDRVFASTVWSGFGSYAEYKTMPEDGILAPMPSNLSFEEAAVIPSGGITALGIIKLGDIQPGDQVLIYGASGSIGTYSVQLARIKKAEITGVCSGSNTGLVRSLGAKKVLDYTKTNFTLKPGSYDLVLDAVGCLSPPLARSALKENGTYLDVHSASDRIKKNLVQSLLDELKTLVEEGQLIPVIDRIFPLEEITAAHRYVEGGHKIGNVAVSIS
jgi:NADPH:quinone reductase-like Zn-dependent oxidoreductase